MASDEGWIEEGDYESAVADLEARSAEEHTFQEIAVQYEDPVQRGIMIGIERARRTLGLDDE